MKDIKTLESMKDMGHEQIVYCNDPETGLRAIIAIHDTTLGPAIGGTRFYDYASEEDALYDVLRLSKGMTYKNAACGLNAGGGKAVIIGDPKKLKNPDFLRAYGRFVNRLNGTYYTAEDMNISEEDVEHILETTPYCVGKKEISGNPSPFTALGVYMGIKAAAKEVFGNDDLKGRKVVVVGLGAVGSVVCDFLKEEGAELIVADVYQPSVDRVVAATGAKAVSVEEAFTTECDIYAPCAMGAIINVDNAKDLRCKIVAGAANNVLVDDAAGYELEKLGILYIPDYIINGGGVLNCGFEIEEGGYDKEKLTEMVKGIYNTVTMIIELGKEKGIPPFKAADAYAEARIEAAKKNK